MSIFDKFKLKTKEHKPISATYLQGFTMPGIGVLVIAIAIILLLTFMMKRSPNSQLREISYPYTLVQVVASDTYVLKNQWGKEETVTISVAEHSSFYNHEIEDLVLGKEVYYKDHMIYFLTPENEITTVNVVVTDVVNKANETEQTELTLPSTLFSNSATQTNNTQTAETTNNFQVIIETTVPNGGF